MPKSVEFTVKYAKDYTKCRRSAFDTLRPAGDDKHRWLLNAIYEHVTPERRFRATLTRITPARLGDIPEALWFADSEQTAVPLLTQFRLWYPELNITEDTELLWLLFRRPDTATAFDGYLPREEELK